MAPSSPEKPEKDSASSDNSDSDDSSSSDSGSSSSSDSDSDNENESKDEPAPSTTTTVLTTNEDKSMLASEPFDPNPLRAATRLKENTDTGLMALGTKKRDRRTIEQIQKELSAKKPKPSNAETRPLPRATNRVVSPALQPSGENITIPNPNSADFSLKTKGKPTTALGRLAQKISGRARPTAKAPVKSTAKPSTSTGTAMTSYLSRPSSSSTASTTTTPPTTTPPSTSPIQGEVEDPKNNPRIVRTILKALQRYGDSTDGNLYAEQQSTFCDEFKQPTYLVRGKLSAHLKVSDDVLEQIAKDMIAQCEAQKAEETIKYADVDIKPAPFLERLFENLKLRVAVQRAMQKSKCKGGAHSFLSMAANLADLGIDTVDAWREGERDCDWNIEKDRALLLGIYIHGQLRQDDCSLMSVLSLEKQRALKSNRLKNRAEKLLKRLPSPLKPSASAAGMDRLQRAAERAKGRADEPPSTSPPPADSIRKEHVAANPYPGKQLQPVRTSSSVASEDEEGEIRSDESDREVRRPFGGKTIRLPQEAKAPPPALLTLEQLNAKYNPKERLKHIRTTLKKVQKIASWAKGQKDDDVVLEKVSKYIVEIGAGIDQEVAKEEATKCDELATCLWTHAATFTPFSAVHFERLYDDMTCDAADAPSSSV
ncbi:hypothetical protein AeRB84_020554 [Aphanomyces euteiches]|nr:hypothetical protein AeRB84_020554 [Aphanomyces euteiches]